MQSPPFDSTFRRTTLGVACHHRRWATHMVEQCQMWHDIITLGLHARSDDVTSHHCPWTAQTVERRRALHATFAFGQHTRSNDVGRGMPSSPLGSTNGRMTSSVACHHRLWRTHTVKRRWVWHAIIAFGQHTRSNNVGRGMTSTPLDCTHGRKTSGVA